MSLLTDSLQRFECRQSDDCVKTDLELTCTECGTVVADVEHGDNLKILAEVADDHICSPDPDEPDEPPNVDDYGRNGTPLDEENERS